MADWLKVTLRTTSEMSETVFARLWSLGTVGIEEGEKGGEKLVYAFFTRDGQTRVEARALREQSWASLGASLESVEVLSDRDWIAPFRDRSRPFPVGRGFLIDPREPETSASTCGPENPGGRFLLRVPARRAFGIGSHESTRLLVEWLEDLDLSGRRVLDVGTGTGILAFVALRRGATSLFAIDRDPCAAMAARENQELNGLDFPIAVGGVDMLSPGLLCDLALVNVLPENIASDLETLRDLLATRGEVLFSGILSTAATGWADRLDRAGFGVVDRRRSGEWEAWKARSEVI